MKTSRILYSAIWAVLITFFGSGFASAAPLLAWTTVAKAGPGGNPNGGGGGDCINSKCALGCVILPAGATIVKEDVFVTKDVVKEKNYEPGPNASHGWNPYVFDKDGPGNFPFSRAMRAGADETVKLSDGKSARRFCSTLINWDSNAIYGYFVIYYN